MLLHKLKVSIATYWISCFIVFFIISPTEFVNTDFHSSKSILESFLLVSYVMFFGVFSMLSQLHYLLNF
ncbi:hypothetical protein JOC74_002908 [Bacillus capparidis]|uniref:Uncharacterized protein n=1 Tax=Bacillus capparidis TaxID=1840411 RepID=A0ABS4CYG7_9BACI|nr:hypothetical protein [Bacillus capparidis]